MASPPHKVVDAPARAARTMIQASLRASLLTLVHPCIGDRLSTRLLLFVGLGAFATSPALANLTLWMGFPARFALTSTLDKCVGYTLAALTFHLLGTASVQPHWQVEESWIAHAWPLRGCMS